jgi:hypothetical protein
VDDQQITKQISGLAEEERGLLAQHVGEGLTPEEEKRLRTIETQLDQCWDLLRQRRALREMGQDPNVAKLRDETTVEGYLQ